MKKKKRIEKEYKIMGKKGGGVLLENMHNNLSKS